MQTTKLTCDRWRVPFERWAESNCYDITKYQKDGPTYCNSFTLVASKAWRAALEHTRRVIGWVPFWFEGNQYFDMVNNPQDWEDLVEVYRKVGKSVDLILDRAMNDPSSPKPTFGFARECNGDESLRSFFIENNMSWETDDSSSS